MKKPAFAFMLLLIVTFNAFRFWKLDDVPSGYHINEVSSAVTLQCMAENHSDAQMRPWPLFGDISYGQDKPPSYIYPGMLWAKIFGSTVASLRALSAVIFLFGVAGLYLLARGFLGPAYGLIVALAATISPWSWMSSRLAIESFLAPVLTIWGLYFLCRSNRWPDWAAAALFFGAAMYAYPPARLQVPLLMLTLLLYEQGRRGLRLSSLVALILPFILVLVPMVVLYAQGALSRRFDAISIFNKDFLYVTGKHSPWDVLSIFFHNYCSHLSFDFLFVSGDHSLMYSTRHWGIFSWLDTMALLIFVIFSGLALWRRSLDNPVIKYRRWIVFLIVNYLIAIIPSALTNQGLPHALRTCGAWPMLMLFTGLMWVCALQALRALWLVLGLAAALSGGIFVYQYFTFYPQDSRTEFGFWAKHIAQQIHSPQDWQGFLTAIHPQEYHFRYFLAHQQGLSCQQARDVWQKMGR